MTPKKSLRQQLHHIIFDYDTLPAKAFDLLLIAAIIMSVTVVMLDTVRSIHDAFRPLLHGIE